MPFFLPPELGQPAGPARGGAGLPAAARLMELTGRQPGDLLRELLAA